MSVRDLHPVRGEAQFEWRGRDPTRVEALTDMVFAFALTLLVVSNAPPQSYPELVDQLWDFPGFAAAFAILLLIWHGHYIFFRRYGLADLVTTSLNAGLLFLILFFIYPLKFHATMLSEFVRSLAAGAPRAPFTLAEAQQALFIFSIAYAAVFLMFAALYSHALAKADPLRLSDWEARATRFSLAQQIIQVAVAVAAASFVALTPLHIAPFGGFIYGLVGPLIMIAGHIFLNNPRAERRAHQDQEELECSP